MPHVEAEGDAQHETELSAAVDAFWAETVEPSVSSGDNVVTL